MESGSGVRLMGIIGQKGDVMSTIGRLLKEMVIVFLAVFAVIYLIFPTLGIFELIPDAVPLIGSMDEATATLIILNTLNYYGLDLTNLYGGSRRRRLNRPAQIIYQPPDRESEGQQ